MAKGHARAAREPKPVPVEEPKKSSKAGKVNPDFGGTGYAVLTGAMVKKIKKNPSKKRGVDEHGSTNTLCHLSDKEDREKCYAEAASLLAQREADILPTFGGRKWRVSVEIKEDARRIREVQKRDEKNKNKGAATSRGASLSDLQNGPLFRWYKNELELAILPNMIQELDIRVLVDLKDEVTYRTVSELNAHKTIHDVVNRNSQDKGLRITEQALRDDVFKPIIKTIWISPQYECIRNWDDVVKTCKELSKRSKVIDRVIYGLGAKGNVMQPKKASTTEALDAGQYRFEKDGLWVVGQENSWQAGNTLILARKAALGLKDDDGFAKKQPSTFRIVQGKALYIEANKQDFAFEKRAELGRIRLADQKAERQKQKALEKLEAARIAKEEADRRAREIVHEKLEAARLAKEEEERLARLAAMPPPPESTLVGGGVPVPVPAPNPAALAEPEGRPRERKAKTAAKNANSSYSKYIEEPLPSQKYIPKKKEPSKYSYTLHMAIRDLGRKYDELPTEEKKVWETQALLANMKAEEAVLKKEREEAVIERKKLFWENREKKHRGPCEPPTEEDMAKDVKPKIGMEVKVRYDDGNWYLGKVTAVDAPFVKLEYEDGETAKEKYEDDDLCLIESEEDIKQREFEAEVLARKEAEDRRLEAELVEKAAAMVPIPMLFGDTLSEAKPMIPQRTITVMAVQPGMQPIAQPRKYKVKSTASAVMKAQGLTGKVCKSCSQFALRGNYGFCAQHRTPLQRVPNPRPPQQLDQPVLAVQQQPVVQQPAVVVQPVAQAQPQQPVPVAQYAEQFNPPPQPPQPMQVVPQYIPQIIEAPVMNNKQQAASVDEFGRLLAEALNKNPLPAPQFSIPVAAVAAMQGRGASWQQPTPPQPPQYVPQPPAPPQPVAQPQPVSNSVMAMPPAVTMSNESPCLPPPGTTKVKLPEFQNWLQHRRQEWRSNVNNNASAKAGDTVSGGVLATATPQPVQAPEPIPVPVPVKVDPAVQERMRMQAIQQQQMAIQQQQIRQRQVQEHLQRAREFKQKQEEYKKEQTNRSNATLVDQACRIFSPVDDQWHNATCKGYDKETMEHEFQIGRKETKKIDINKYMILWEKDRVNHKSDQYGLNEEQIRVCYDAAIDHYEQVMHTVKSRGLAHELQEGFDVLRERGFGRYDMTVPEYSKFEFLTSPNAAWMPIVHRCLGEKVERVHMGCFLSLPGSHHQIYHQDGVHLSETTQRPCHAVNVFIPLVDLCMANGPTEFVLGSHILENDDYDRSKIETPTAPAGSPVIFDYRTGHRGMGNSTEEARPILYLTYSADGKFSDKVNFDQRSFHKLGQMVEMPKSRDERKKERGVHPPKVEKVEGGTLEGGTCGDSAGVGHQQEHEHHHHDLNNNTVATSTNMEVEVVGSMPAATTISPPTPAAPCLQPMVGVTTSSAPVVTQPDPVAPPVAPPAAPPVAQPVVFI